MAWAEKMLRSKPGPSCQNRKQYFPGRSRTVNCSTRDDPERTSRPLICFDVGCFVRASSRLTLELRSCGATSRWTCSGIKTKATKSKCSLAQAESKDLARMPLHTSLREQRLSPEARKRQFMQMAASLEVTHILSMRLIHQLSLATPHWQSQWHTRTSTAQMVSTSVPCLATRPGLGRICGTSDTWLGFAVNPNGTLGQQFHDHPD